MSRHCRLKPAVKTSSRAVHFPKKVARAGCSNRRYYNTKLQNDLKNFILGGSSPRSLPICGILSIVENETLSTLYAFAGQAGPQGQRRRVLISNLGILPARHRGQSQEPRPAHRAGPSCEWIELGHMALAHRLTALTSRSRGSAVIVYICQGSFMSTALGLLTYFWSMTGSCIHFSRRLPSCAGAIWILKGLG